MVLDSVTIHLMADPGPLPLDMVLQVCTYCTSDFAQFGDSENVYYKEVFIIIII